MKVALVFPRTRYPSGDPPLGVAYLAASLRERLKMTPTVLDTTFQGDPLAFLKREFAAGQFDLIGISAMVTMAQTAAAVAELAKEVRRETFVIMGGPHATTLPEEVLKQRAVDAVCVGEGEEALVELAKKGEPREVPGFFMRDGKGGIRGEPRPVIPDLDRLPFPALELLPMEKYFRHWFQLDSVAPGLKGTSVLATRGCPFRCSYCQPTLDKLFGKGVRKRSPRHLVDELSRLKASFGLQGFLFADDTFIADRKWVLDFCEELQNSQLGLIWGCNVRADLVSEDLLLKMQAAGLRKIYLGIEVFDDERRKDVFQKGLTRKQVEAAVEAARSLGIKTQGYFMLGAPGESRHDVWETIRYSWRLPLDDATFNLTTPLPGTYLFEKYREMIRVEPEEMDYYRRWAFAPSGELTQAWLTHRQVIAYAGFYGQPRRLLRQAGDLFSAGGASRLWSKLRRVL